MAISKLLPWDGSNGGNKIFWANAAQLAGEMIKEYNLRPVQIGAQFGGARGPAMASADVMQSLIDLGIKGGIRVSHLHFANKIYLLDDKQWSKFSRGVVSDARAKLAKAKQLGFEETVLLGSLAETHE